MAKEAITKLEIRRVQSGVTTEVEDLLATEEPLEIRLIYGSKVKPVKKNLAVTMRTPGNDEELSTGFLYTEGIISDIDDIAAYEEVRENVIQITLKEHVTLNLDSLDRNFYTTSSCGVCGKASIDAIKTECNIYDKAKPFTVSPEVIYQLPETLRTNQSMFRDTGGIHAAALFDTSGKLLIVREDVGRHNAMDKLVGAALKSGLIPLNNHLLLLSGRASFELVQKATMAGVKLVASVGAPSSLAVETADEFGMTLIGFLKQDRLNIYTGTERIKIN